MSKTTFRSEVLSLCVILELFDFAQDRLREESRISFCVVVAGRRGLQYLARYSTGEEDGGRSRR